MVVHEQVSNACLEGVFVNGGKGETANLVKFFINICNIRYIFPSYMTFAPLCSRSSLNIDL